MRIEPAQPSDLPSIRWLLEYENLPVEDLTESSLQQFIVCRDDKGIFGAVGLERCGPYALLRSLVVAEDRRGESIGTQLTAIAVARAQRAQFKAVYLLTTTAQRFFARCGFRVVSRDETPAEIANTTQFTQLCPATAVLMVKP